MLQTIRNVLQEHIKQGALSLSAATTGRPEVEALLTEIDPQGVLQIESVELSPPDKPLAITGRGRFWNVDDADITVRFSEMDDSLIVVLSANPPIGWVIAKSFPQLPDTLGLDRPLLFALALTQATFELSTAMPGETPGLILSVKASLEGPLALLKTWVDGNELTLRGPVALSAQVPTLELGVALPEHGDLGPVSLKEPKLRLRTALDRNLSDTSDVTIAAILQVGSALTTAVEGELILLDDTPMQLTVRAEQLLTLSSITDLLTTLSEDLAHGLAGLPDIQHLGLGALRIDVLPAQMTISRLAVQLDKGGPAWQIGLPQRADPLLTLEDLSLDLEIAWPLQPYRRWLSATAYTRAEFLSREFEVSAMLPGPVISMSMQGEPLRLSQLLNAKQIFPSGFSPTGLPVGGDLALKTLFVKLDAGTGTLLFDGAFDGNLSLALPGQQEMALEDPQLSLRVALYNPSGSVMGLRGRANIAFTTSEVEAAVSLKTLELYAVVPQVRLSALIEHQLGVQSTLPELDLERAFVSITGGEVHLSGTLASDFKIPIGQSQLAPRRIQLDVGTDAKGLFARLAGAAALGHTNLRITSTLHDSTLTLAGHIPQLNLRVLVDDMLGVHAGVPELEIVDLEFDLASGGVAHLNANNIDLDFAGIARSLGLHPPAGTPNPKLSEFKASFDPSGSLVTLHCDDCLPFTEGMTARNFEFKISHEQATGLTVALGFFVEGSVTIAEGSRLNLAVSVSGASNGEFTAHGNAHISLFGAEPIELHAKLAGATQTRSLELHYRGQALPLVDTPDVFRLIVKTLSLALVKDEDQTHFEMDSACSLAIGPLSDIDASLSIAHQQGASRLTLQADVDPLVLPALKLPGFAPDGDAPGIDITLHDLGLSFATAAQQGEADGLSLTAAARLRFSNFAPFDSFIGEQLEGELRASARSLFIACEIPAALQDKQWPVLTVQLSDSESIALPVPTLQARVLGLDINKDAPAFTSEWRVSVPPELNKLIGADLFAEQFDLRLEIGKAVGLWPTGKPSWPFRALQTEEIEGSDWLRLGSLLVEVPRLAFDGASWTARDLGVKGLRSFGIPLAPLKFLLRQCQVPAPVVDRLPDSVPLGGINLDAGGLDQEIPRLLGKAAVQQLDELLKSSGKTLTQILGAISGATAKLPDNMQEYFKFDIPDEAQLDIGITGSGGMKVNLRVDPEHPLRLMLPYMGLPPGLLGVTIRELSIGEGAAGQLLMLGFDGHIDQFDFITLFDAVASADGQRFAHRYTLNKVFAVAPTALPIPIPLFFSELALDHVDFLGFELHSHWSFGPQEQPGLIELIELVGALIPFFTKRDYYLHEPGHMPQSLALPFSIGANNFRIPEYLGGGELLGLSGDLPAYNVTDSIAFLLDAIKDLNPAFAIQAIPLMVEEADKRHWIRVNKLAAQIAFGPIRLSANAAWCIATEAEFKGPIAQYATTDGVLSPAALQGVFQSLPQGADTSAKGFVIFLMGGWDLQSIAGMQCQFGIAYTRDAGFQTGLRLTTTLGGVLAFTLGGTIRISQDRQNIEGDTQLLLKSGAEPTNLLKAQGLIEVTDTPEKSLRVMVALQIGLLGIGGTLIISESALSMTGTVGWSDTEFSPDGEATVQFLSSGVTATFRGTLQQLSGSVTAQLPQLTASVEIDLSDAFQQEIQGAIVALAQKEADATIDQAYAELTRAIANIDSYTGSIADMRKTAVPRICDAINRMIDQKTKAYVKKYARWPVTNRVKKYVKDKAKPYKTALNNLKAAARKSNAQLVKAADAMIVQGQKKLFGVKPLSGSNLAQVKTLVNAIRGLDDNTRIRVSREQILSQSDRLFAKVRASTDASLADAIPKVESLNMQLSLEQIVPAEIQARIQFASGSPLEIMVFPDSPSRTAAAVADALKMI